MDFDWNGFVKDVILVAIPTGVGAFTSKFLTNSWQERREKSRIKREILAEFKNSIKNSSSAMFLFTTKIMNYYTSYGGLEFNTVDKSVLPKEYSKPLDNPPFNKFIELHEKLEEEYLQLDYTGSTFLSSLRLYYRNDELEDEYGEIAFGLTQMINSIRKLMKVNNYSELQSSLLECFQHHSLIRNMIKDFEKKLIDTDLHNLTL
jgi:hypothetical protein